MIFQWFSTWFPLVFPDCFQSWIVEISLRIGCSKGFHRSVTFAVLLAGLLVTTGRSVEVLCPTLRQSPDWDPFQVSRLDLIWIWHWFVFDCFWYVFELFLICFWLFLSMLLIWFWSAFDLLWFYLSRSFPQRRSITKLAISVAEVSVPIGWNHDEDVEIADAWARCGRSRSDMDQGWRRSSKWRRPVRGNGGRDRYGPHNLCAPTA